jgi:pimeloyl-ACP methyl ester carboxylesterase
MANSNLLVPGTGGVTLIDNHGNDVGWPVLMRLKGVIRGIQGRSNDELTELLGMEHRPGQLAPAKTSLKPGVSLLPGHVLRVAYNQLEDMNRFRYDWRADMRWTASQLLDFIRERQPADGRWNLVGHSQGGLLIILASKLLDAEDEFSRYVATATLVGSPIAGTLNAANGMLEGDNAGKRLAPAVRATMRTWPAIYQMLPAWPAVVDGGRQPVAAAEQLTQPGGWPGVTGIQADLLERARAAQALLRDPFTHMRGVDVRLYLAGNRNTISAIRRPKSGPLKWKEAGSTTGDTLVPYDVTMRQMGEACWPHVTKFAAPCEPHAYLCNDATMIGQLRRRFA